MSATLTSAGATSTDTDESAGYLLPEPIGDSLNSETHAFATPSREQFIAKLVEIIEPETEFAPNAWFDFEQRVREISDTVALVMIHSPQDAFALAEVFLDRYSEGEDALKVRRAIAIAVVSNLPGLRAQRKTYIRLQHVSGQYADQNDKIRWFHECIKHWQPENKDARILHAYQAPQIPEGVASMITEFYGEQWRGKEFTSKKNLVPLVPPEKRRLMKLLGDLSTTLNTKRVLGTVFYSEVWHAIQHDPKAYDSIERAIENRYDRTMSDTIEIDGERKPGSLAARLGSLSRYRKALLKPSDPFEAMEARETVLDLMKIAEERRSSFRSSHMSLFSTSNLILELYQSLGIEDDGRGIMANIVEKTRAAVNPFLRTERAMMLGKLRRQLSVIDVEERKEEQEPKRRELRLGTTRDDVNNLTVNSYGVITIEWTAYHQAFESGKENKTTIISPHGGSHTERTRSTLTGEHHIYRYPNAFLVGDKTTNHERGIRDNSIIIGCQSDNYWNPTLTPSGALWFIPKEIKGGTSFHYCDGTKTKEFRIEDNFPDFSLVSYRIFNDDSLCLIIEEKNTPGEGFMLSLHTEMSEIIYGELISPRHYSISYQDKSAQYEHQLLSSHKSNQIQADSIDIPELPLPKGVEFSKVITLEQTPAFMDNTGVVHVFNGKEWISPLKSCDNNVSHVFSSHDLNVISVNAHFGGYQTFVSREPENRYEGYPLDFKAIDNIFYMVRRFGGKIQIDSCSISDSTDTLTPFCTLKPHIDLAIISSASLHQINGQNFLKIVTRDRTTEYYYTDGSNRRFGPIVDNESFSTISDDYLHYLTREEDEWVLYKYSPETVEVKPEPAELEETIQLLEDLDAKKIEAALKQLKQQHPEPIEDQDAHPGQIHIVNSISKEDPTLLVEAGYREQQEPPTHYRLRTFLKKLFPGINTSPQTDPSTGMDSATSQHFDRYQERDAILSGDPRGQHAELIKFSRPISAFAPTGYYSNPDEAGIWSRSLVPINRPSSPDTIGNTVEATFTVPGHAQDIVLITPEEAELKELRDSLSGTRSYSVDNHLIHSTDLSDIEGEQVSYTFQMGKEQQVPKKLTDDEYRTFIEKTVKKYGRESIEPLGKLPFEADRFAQTVSSLPVAERIVAIRDWVRRHGYYDQGYAETKDEETQLSITERMALMSERMDVIRSERTKGEEIEGKLYAGVCADFAVLTAAMLRRSGVMCEVVTGYNIAGDTLTTGNAHALVACPWPDQDDVITRIYVDSTADNAPIEPVDEDMIDSLQQIQIAEERETRNSSSADSFSTLSMRQSPDFERHPDLQKIFDVLIGVPEIYQEFAEGNSETWEEALSKWYNPSRGILRGPATLETESVLKNTLLYNIDLMSDLFSISSERAKTITTKALNTILNHGNMRLSPETKKALKKALSLLSPQ